MPTLPHLMPFLLMLCIAPATAATPLQITGELVASTCRVHGNSAGDSIAVQLGRIDLATVNTHARAGRKEVRVLMDCRGWGGEQPIRIRLDGVARVPTGHLELGADSSARNVVVALFDADDTPLRIGEDRETYLHSADGRQRRFDFTAWYASPGRNATAGTANARGELVVVYP